MCVDFQIFQGIVYSDNGVRRSTCKSSFQDCKGITFVPEDTMTALKNNEHYFDISFEKLSSPGEHYSGIEFKLAVTHS